MDYGRLAADFKLARDSAERAVAQNPDDSGTPNRNATVIYLPKAWPLRVNRAGEAAGLRVTRLSEEGSWRISTPHHGRGDLNTRQAEAMRDVLRDAGWDVDVQYRMS